MKRFWIVLILFILFIPVAHSFELDSDGDGYLDMTIMPLDELWTFQAGVTISTGKHFTLGTTQWDDGSNAIDGEKIGNNTIDDDSIDFGTGTDQVSLLDFGLAITHDTAAELDALYEAELTNSARLLAALDDETGTGVAVFGTAPTFTTSITIGSNVITEAEAGYLEDVTSSVQDQMDLKAPLASPTFTGTVVLPASQALITPVLGTPTSGTLTNCTGLPTAGISDAHAGTDITADLEEEVTEGSLADSVIVSADIKDGVIVNADVNAAAAIDGTKLNITSLDITVASGKILVGNVSNLAEAQTPSGAVTMSNAGVFQAYVTTPLSGTAADFDDNFTGANLYGGTYRVTTEGACLLPDPVVGMHFTILHEIAAASTIVSLGTGTADTIYMNGLAAAQDEDLTASAIGAMCVFQYQAADTWMATCNDFTEATPP